MPYDIEAFLDHVIGLRERAGSLTLLQVSVRAALTYLFGYFLLRIGEHRFVGKNTAIDVVLGFIFGATLSRAINGAAPFLDTLVAGAILLGLHWAFAWIAFRSDRANVLLNGEAIPIVKDGEVLEENARAQRINDRLLQENLRLRGSCNDVAAVEEAYYERSGAISVIPKRRSASSPDSEEAVVRVVEVRVEEGVQTVRIEVQ